MFSDEFMHFLIKYQQPEELPKKITNFEMPRGKKELATIALTIKK